MDNVLTVLGTVLGNKNNFIGDWFLDDKSVCDELIEFFNKTPNKIKGASSSGYNPNNKESLEVPIYQDMFGHPIISKYAKQLQIICNKYIKKYPWCNSYNPWKIIEGYNIQYYPPGGGYKIFHTERTEANTRLANRHLAFMTYLNDVFDQGETEFYHQKLKVKPRKGRTLIWPCDWTHTHRGIPSKTQEKIIITGWYSFV